MFLLSCMIILMIILKQIQHLYLVIEHIKIINFELSNDVFMIILNLFYDKIILQTCVILIMISHLLYLLIILELTQYFLYNGNIILEQAIVFIKFIVKIVLEQLFGNIKIHFDGLLVCHDFDLLTPEISYIDIFIEQM